MGWYAAEADLHQFFGMEDPMGVTACSDGCGEYGAGGVDRLEDVGEVDAACDLLDEYWGEAFRAQILVNVEEVDLNHVNGTFVGADNSRKRR